MAITHEDITELKKVFDDRYVQIADCDSVQEKFNEKFAKDYIRLERIELLQEVGNKKLDKNNWLTTAILTVIIGIVVTMILKVLECSNMAKTCNSCNTNDMAVMPIAQHEKDQNRLMGIIKRLIAVIVTLIVLLVGYIAFDKWRDSQYEDVVETEEITVDAEDSGTANYIGNDGDIYNGKDND